MAPTKDCSATAMPKVLISSAVGLLVLRVAVSLIACFTPAPQSPASAAIGWQDAAQVAALPPKAKEKLVLYQFYAKWSDACKNMDANALSNPQITDLVSENFVAVRITDQAHELGKNPEWISDLQKKYRVFALPTLVAVDENGEQVGTLIGNCSSLSTYRFLSRILHNDKQHPLRTVMIRPARKRPRRAAEASG